MRHHVQPAGVRAERDEAAIASGVLDRELHDLGQQAVHVGGLAEQAVRLFQRAELVACGQRNGHVLTLDLAPQRHGAALGLRVAALGEPLLGLLEERERLVVALALALQPRQRQQGLRGERNHVQLAED